MTDGAFVWMEPESGNRVRRAPRTSSQPAASDDAGVTRALVASSAPHRPRRTPGDDALRFAGAVSALSRCLEALRARRWRLAPPRFHLLRYFGVLSSHSALRSEVVPHPPPDPTMRRPPPAAGDQMELFETDDHRPPRRKRWAWLLRHVWQVDLDTCPRCHGRIRVLSAITDAAIAKRIVDHLGIPSQVPEVAAARVPRRRSGRADRGHEAVFVAGGREALDAQDRLAREAAQEIAVGARELQMTFERRGRRISQWRDAVRSGLGVQSFRSCPYRPDWSLSCHAR